MQCPFLIGPTVYLRPLGVEDARAIVPWFNDPDVTRFTLRYQPMTVTEEEDWLRQHASSPTSLVVGIVLPEGDRLIGTAGLHEIDARNRHASFGITLGDKSCWGKGLGTEVTRLIVEHAFRTLNLNRVYLHVYEYNPRAIRTYEKVGFRVEGRLRQDTFRDGRYWDTLVMGLLRDEHCPRQEGTGAI